MKYKCLIARCMLAMMLMGTVPVSAEKLGDSTDKYSDTNAIQEDRKSLENIGDDKDEPTSQDYLESSLSPNQIKQTSNLPEGFNAVDSIKRDNGYGVPVVVTNDADVIIKRDAPRRVLTGTVLRSINNKCAEDLYQPNIKDIPWIKSKIVKDLNYAALYTGEWDSDNVEAKYSVSSVDNKDPDRQQDGEKVVKTRVTKILGSDILVVNENYSESSGYTATTLKSNSAITLRDAITVSYKALSDNYYWIQAYPRTMGTVDIPVEKTPFAEAVGAENCSVDHNRYYTDVWVSRTCPKTYYEQAVRDGITSYTYDEEESLQDMTIGDFCVIVQKLLDLNGEEVITDQEAKQLLQVYQRNIPTYLTSIQKDAIKYLMVRGIVDGTEDFNAKISAEEMLSILTRAKDKASRLTFKQVDVEYNKDILAKGFTGVQMTPIAQSPAKSIQVEPQNAVAEYYDYFVKKTDKTTFKDINGKEVTALYVAANKDALGDAGGGRVIGSEYIGEVNGYYHFKVPITADMSSAFSSDSFPSDVDKVFTVTTRNADNKPKKFYMQAGGGMYDKFTTVTIDNEEYVVAMRTPFTSVDDPLLTDYERKNSQQMQMTEGEEVKLTSNYYKATIAIWNKDLTKWAGTKCADITTDTKGQDLGGAKVHMEYDDNGNSKLIVEYANEKSPWNSISENLSSDTMNSTENHGEFPAYIMGNETTPTVLLSYNWLKNNGNGLPNRITQEPQILEGTDENDQKYEIKTEGGPIQVDCKNKTFAIGACYTELGQNDKSPLIVKDSGTGDYYIDYRVITSCSAGYMIFDNSDSTKSFVPTDVHGGTPENMPSMKNIKSLTGSTNDTLTVGAEFTTDGKLMLEGPYAKANFMVYKLNRQGLRGDFLLVFKPKCEEVSDTDTTEIKEKLAKDFNVSLGKNATCSIYNLDSTVTNANSNLVHSLNSKVENRPGYGYVYDVQDASHFNVQSYYFPGDNSSSPLPIVKYGDSYYDVNTNCVQGFSYDKVPGALLVDELKSMTGGHDLSFDKGFKSTGSNITFSDKSQMIPAPIGLTACYKDEYDKKASELASSDNDSTYKSVGATGGTLGTITTSATDYSFNICNGAYNYKIKADDQFYLAGGDSSQASNRSRGIYVYKDPDGVGITSLNDLSNSELGLKAGIIRNIFDWKMFSFIETLKTAEDISTICYIILLEIAPRLMIFDFLALATLSLVARNNVMQFICSKTIDPYKILSLGILDVNTIDVKRIWVSTFFACIMLAMLNALTFTDILDWMVRGVLGILSR